MQTKTLLLIAKAENEIKKVDFYTKLITTAVV
jgi:hypothetical protein